MSHHPHSPPSKKRKATTPTSLKSSSVSLPLEIWGRCILPFCNDPELLAIRATNSTFHGLVHPLLLAKTEEPIKQSYDLTVQPKSKFQYCRLTCQVIARPPPPENRNNDDLPRSTTDQRIPQRTEQHNAPTFLSFQQVKNYLDNRKDDCRLEPERDDELGEDQLGEREWGLGLYGDKFENLPGWKGFIRKMDYKMEEFLGTMKFNRKIGLDKEEVEKLLTKWRQLTCCTRYRLLRRNIREGENPTPILRDRYTHADFSYEEETDEESDMYTETYSFFLEVELFNGEQVELMLTREAKMHKHVRTGYKPYRPSASRKAWANTRPS